MSRVTRLFGGEPGQPYTAGNTGVLIGKKPDQKGINAFQVANTRVAVVVANIDRVVCVVFDLLVIF